MKILYLRTDKPQAEVGLFDDERLLASDTWLADRQLAESLHKHIKSLLESSQLSWWDIGGVAVFRGPGSFTGLRIGLTVANTLAQALKVPIMAGSGDDWQLKAVKKLLEGCDEQLVMPEYGAEPHITLPKK